MSGLLESIGWQETLCWISDRILVARKSVDQTHVRQCSPWVVELKLFFSIVLKDVMGGFAFGVLIDAFVYC